MQRSIAKYISDCESCRRNKPRLTKTPGLLQSLKIPGARWSHISLDFIIELAPSGKFKFTAILVIVCRLTKRCHFIPTYTKLSTQEFAKLFLLRYVSLHGIPLSIVSDRDSKLTSKFFTELAKLLQTDLNMTVAHRAQGDGQTERMNRTLEEYIRAYISPLQNNWDEYLGLAEFAINSSYNNTIKMTPFEADLGYNPRDAISIATPDTSTNASADTFLDIQQANLKRCIDSIRDAQETMAFYYNKNRPEQIFQEGDQVLLSTKYLDEAHTGFPTIRKFGPKWIGPYTIEKKISRQAYRLKFAPGIKFYPVFNTGSLKPYKKITTRKDNQSRQVILADGSIGQQVEAVLDSRKRKKKTQYEFKWLGETKTTWEEYDPIAHKQVQGLIDQFEANKKNKSTVSR